MSEGPGDNASALADYGPSSASEVAPLSTMATAMLFGTVTFATVSLAVRTYLSGDLRAVRQAENPRSSPLELRSFASIYTLLHHSTVFGFILFYAYICEYHPPFPHANKSYDRDDFFFMTGILFLASAFTLSKNDKNSKPKKQNGDSHIHDSKEGQVAEVNDANEVLNRNQTEEWKGWMQYMFLLYHYYHAEEVYNAIRIMITCYVWMTGFGNFSFFYLTGDFSAVRVVQMLWRLNFLVIFLCLSQGTTYILYYICLLHTYFFLMVYVTMRIAKHVNYTKWGIRIKMGVLAIIIFLIWDVDNNLFRLLHSPFLGETPMLGAPAGSMWEWYFRSSLDHWSTFLGMIFALNFPITSLFFRKIEAQPLWRHVLAKGAVGLALFGAFLAWVTGPFQQNKFEYNATNAYFGFIPLIAYIYFRNLTPWLRSHSLDLLHQIGKTTLETYLMQHHIWLTSNAKSLLTLIPGWPKVNMLVVTIIYYFLSRRLYQLTLFLRGMVLPDDRNKCFWHLAFLAGCIGFYYGLAFALQSLGILSLSTVAVVSLLSGLLLYRAIIHSTWERYKESASSSLATDSNASVIETVAVNNASKSGRHYSTAMRYPPIVGAAIVLIVGLVWQGMSQAGAGKIEPLPEGCMEFVNQGAWIPVDVCNEESRGAGYREYGIASYGTCLPQSRTYVWGWNETQSRYHCRFVQRDAKSLRSTLKHRTITFMGDSISRLVYQATLRALGNASAGAYNTNLPKWSDMNETIGQTTVEFEWAPYSRDLVSRLQNITKRPLRSQAASSSVQPDVIILGGGAWDRLHIYSNASEIESHRDTVIDLAKEIGRVRATGIPLIWIVPTTINSNALLTDEKREKINEENMSAMRAVYAKLGVLEASWLVLDGPAFTSGRVAESYDGVHYPHGVYDAGAQILANAMDWLPELDETELFTPPQPGAMANPSLGFMILLFAFLGVVFFDGFMGFSYLASIFVSNMKPCDLYAEAFTSLHLRKNLPQLELAGNGPSTRTTKKKGKVSGPCTPTSSIGQSLQDEEAVSLIAANSKGLEMSSL